MGRVNYLEVVQEPFCGANDGRPLALPGGFGDRVGGTGLDLAGRGLGGDGDGAGALRERRRRKADI